jgi:acyl-CoA oxidase
MADTLAQMYTLPLSTHPDGPLALHEISLFEEATETISSSSDFTQAFAQYVQPRCQLMVESMGHRKAYDAAVDQGVPQCLVDLYLINAIKTDAAWYVERSIFTRQTIMRMKDTALLVALPRLDELLAAIEIESYISSPVISDEYWEKFSKTLPVYSSPQAEVPAQPTFWRELDFEVLGFAIALHRSFAYNLSSLSSYSQLVICFSPDVLSMPGKNPCHAPIIQGLNK